MAHGPILTAFLLHAPMPPVVGKLPELATTFLITRMTAEALLTGNSEVSNVAATDLMDPLLPPRIERWRLAVRRTFEPELRTCDGECLRSAPLRRRRRLLRQAGVLGPFDRAAISLRRAR